MVLVISVEPQLARYIPWERCPRRDAGGLDLTWQPLRLPAAHGVGPQCHWKTPRRGEAPLPRISNGSLISKSGYLA